MDTLRAKRKKAISVVLNLALCAVSATCARPTQGDPPESLVRSTKPTLSATPILSFSVPDSIGGASNEMGEAFRLSKGRIAVGDWAGQRVLVFDSTGSLLHTFGRAGSGPDEFRAPTLVQALAGDSVLVWDPYLRRLSWLSTESGKSRVLQIETSKLQGGRPVVGILSDGTILARHDVWQQTGRATARVLLLDQSGDSIGGLPFEIPITNYDENGFRLLGSGGHLATDGELVYVGAGGEWRIAVLSYKGESLGVLQRPWKAREVTEADRTRVRAAFTQRWVTPRHIEDSRFEKTWPPHGKILPAADGTVWVLDHTPPYQYGDSVSVFASDRRFLGTLALPSRFYPTDVGSDWILGIGVGDDDDFRVQLYSVTWDPGNTVSREP